MAKSMKVTVVCNMCSDVDSESKKLEPVEMISDGPLALNTNTLSQSQSYVCPECHNSILLIVEVK